VPSLGIAPLEIKGDLALISDSSGTQRTFPASIARPRAALAKKVEQQGFAQTMEQAAYSWFNRLCALRYMEIKGYLDHGRRVLSAADGSAGVPEILEDCLEIELEGLDKARITELKLDGNKDEELYRELLLAQCQALHQAMPFLFEAVDDALELLLPDNLTKTDSLIRELVAAIPEEDWQDVEIIGWLYQLHQREEGAGDRQGDQERGHPCRHPAVHPQLDRPVPGAEQPRPPVAADLPGLAAQGQDALLRGHWRTAGRGAGATGRHHPGEH
jgi:hypothetical protein